MKLLPYFWLVIVKVFQVSLNEKHKLTEVTENFSN